ncbi:MAG: hypothetical protein EHM46_04245 [Bacteroidetes bacterium]|nr:MAG: hypothetical protein EHM46_04245 [Bacteroidota bacterium]
MEARYLKYRVTYLESRAGDVPTRILPDVMDSYYTESFVLTRIHGFFEQFSLVQIADLRRRKVTTLLNFFGTKVCYTGRSGELPPGVFEPGKLEVEYTGETRVIGGLNSERICVDTGTEQFSMYITRDFDIRRPNITTPYHFIDYPLSDFRIQLSLLKMHLTCEESEITTVESSIFSVPEEYREVSREAMEHIINSLFTKD